MFRNLLKKKERPVEMKQEWASYFCLVDSRQASIRLNLALAEIAPMVDYRYRIWFSVKLLNPDENGLTTKEEFPKICRIEDDIVKAFEAKSAVFAGAVKTNGTFDIYLYSKSANEYEQTIRSIMKNHSDYPYATDCKEDAEWSDYFNFLYPAEYEFQTIMNQRVLMGLEQHGNNPEKEREVDHWIYFRTEKDRDSFIKKAEALGYQVLSTENLNDGGENPYQLNISRQDNTQFGNVNQYVWELVSLAKDNNGHYDGWGCPIAE
jgi:uncharacterized protein (TIGR01619 family)